MVEAANELILKVLQQVQDTQGSHTRLLEEHTQGFVCLERRLDEGHESMITALGLAGHVNVRQDTVPEKLEDLTRRIEVLEQTK